MNKFEHDAFSPFELSLLIFHVTIINKKLNYSQYLKANCITATLAVFELRFQMPRAPSQEPLFLSLCRNKMEVPEAMVDLPVLQCNICCSSQHDFYLNYLKL